jgi:hypothetical protein
MPTDKPQIFVQKWFLDWRNQNACYIRRWKCRKNEQVPVCAVPFVLEFRPSNRISSAEADE